MLHHLLLILSNFLCLQSGKQALMVSITPIILITLITPIFFTKRKHSPIVPVILITLISPIFFIKRKQHLISPIALSTLIAPIISMKRKVSPKQASSLP